MDSTKNTQNFSLVQIQVVGDIELCKLLEIYQNYKTTPGQVNPEMEVQTLPKRQ